MKKLSILFALAGTLAAQQKKPMPVPTQQSPVKTFARSCEAIRPIAVRVAIKSGWKVDASKLTGNITAPEGVIRFASGDRECDVYVKNASRENGEQILRDIAAKLGSGSV